ncbi:MAG: hypothetical protein U5K29_00295 [Acidimicrobiales bacterium]|nr:hypothetical protein [Acidimicrobiales bacterium]
MMWRLLALLGVLALAAAACGDDSTTITADDPTSTSATVSSTTTSTTTPPPDDDPADEGDEGEDPVDARPDYEGGYDVDPESGEVDVSEYADFLADHGPPTGGGPVDAALELLGEAYGEVEPDVSSRPADGGRTIVAVELGPLQDDSVAAVRFELIFIGGEAGDLVLESASWASRCQPGRGHQEFSTGLCR